VHQYVRHLIIKCVVDHTEQTIQYGENIREHELKMVPQKATQKTPQRGLQMAIQTASQMAPQLVIAL
jgi:hypothetical protein